MTPEENLVVQKYMNFTLPTGFPGLSEVFDVLPHPGQMLLDFFRLFYRQVRLIPVLPRIVNKNIKYNAPLAIHQRGWELVSEKDSPAKLAFMGPTKKEQRIVSSNIGRTTDEVNTQKRRAIKNRLQKMLDECTFYLDVHSSFEPHLTRSEYFGRFFWERLKADGIYHHPIDPIKVRLDQVQGPIVADLKLGTDLTDGKGLFLKWQQLLMPGIYRDILDTVLKWYKIWLDAKNLVVRGGAVDCKRTWSTCSHEILEALGCFFDELKSED